MNGHTVCYFEHVRGLFDKFVENVYKFVSVYSSLLLFAYDTGQYVYDIYCKFLLNMFICKKVTHVLLTYGNKHCHLILIRLKIVDIGEIPSFRKNNGLDIS